MFDSPVIPSRITGLLTLWWMAIGGCMPFLNAQIHPEVKVIRRLEMVGNYKTKPWIIRYEIPFEEGDTLLSQKFPTLLSKAKKNLINTRLFSSVRIDTVSRHEMVDVKVTVRELWYLYPGLIFELADRNINTWWTDQNHSIQRVNIGMQLLYENASGRNDYLKFIAHTGYTNKVQLTYGIPRLKHYRKWGFGVDLFRRTQKEIDYLTVGNKQVYYKDEKVLLTRQRIENYLTFRPDQNRVFRLTMGFQYNRVEDIVIDELNANYFKPQKNKQRFFMLETFGKINHLDREIYPTEGMALEMSLRKEGLGIYHDLNVLNINLLWKVYHTLPVHNWSFGAVSRIQKQWSPSETIPFYNRSFIGYSDDQLRGYELYVMDGPEYFYTKPHLKYKFFDRTLQVHHRSESLLRAFKKIPIEMYLIFQLDVGRVEGYTDFQNNLNDRWLFGGGPALHIVTFNRYTYRLEYSFNQLGERGIFIHINRKY